MPNCKIKEKRKFPFIKRKWYASKIRTKVGAGDDIEWTSDQETEFEIWCPPNRDPLQPGPTSSTDGTLERTVKKDAKKGIYEYSLFCEKNNEMAEGDSPPRIIIEE